MRKFCCSLRGWCLLVSAGVFTSGLASRSWANDVYWIGGTDSQWTTAANWSTDKVPGPGDDVFLNQDPVNGPYIVTLDSGAQSVNSVTTEATANLTISGGAALSLNTMTNASTIEIDPGSTFEAFDPVINNNVIDIAGGVVKLDQGLASGSVRAQLQSGDNGFKWNGVGINSSAITSPKQGKSIGYSVNGSAYVLEIAWLGDTNLDGKPTPAEIENMTSKDNPNATWGDGDYDYNGLVNADDYALGQLGLAIYEQSLPEPGGVMLAGAAGLFLLRRNARRS